MNEKTMRELDAWIAENMMGFVVKKNPRISASEGRKFYDPSNCKLLWWADDSGPTHVYFQPTESPTDAMAVLKKCAELEQIGMEIDTRSGMAEVYTTLDPDGFCKKAEAETLELAICRFAKELFSK